MPAIGRPGGSNLGRGLFAPRSGVLLAVSATVLEYGGDEDLAIAGPLHDAVEDQSGKARFEDVRNRFGDRVARVVAACSSPRSAKTRCRQKHLAPLLSQPSRQVPGKVAQLADELHEIVEALEDRSPKS